MTILVPRGNSTEKNAAMKALGAELIEHGRDFQEAKDEAYRLAGERNLTIVPPFHPDLMLGVGTYALELFRAAPDLHTVYVPIGMGSGICGVIGVRDALGLSTRVVGRAGREGAVLRALVRRRAGREHGHARTLLPTAWPPGFRTRRPSR